MRDKAYFVRVLWSDVLFFGKVLFRYLTIVLFILKCTVLKVT